MGKAATFADKMAKSQQDFSKHCRECGESLQIIKLVTADKSEKTGAYRFKEKLVGICKCNENSIY